MSTLPNVTRGYVVLSAKASQDAVSQQPYYAWMPDAAIVASDEDAQVLLGDDWNLSDGDSIHACEYHAPENRSALPYWVSPYPLATWRDGFGWNLI